MIGKLNHNNSCLPVYITDEFKKLHGQIAQTQIRLLLHVEDYAEETQSMATFVNFVVCWCISEPAWSSSYGPN